jgi:type IV secretion system protein VirB11
MDRLHASLTHNFGPIIMEALRDPDVIEIMVNPDQTLWIEKLGQDMALRGKLAPAQSRLIISLVASALETTVTADRPIVEGELPLDGSRFEGLMPPIVSGPSFTIRKRASRVFTLDDYVASGILSLSASVILAKAIEARRNILVVGGTGSGKTTFANAIIDGISRRCPGDRLIVIEDTAELQSASDNTVFMRCSDGVPIQRLVKVSMRYRPTRILVGEVRDGSALDLLKAWNTGHPGGVATVHAGSAAAGLLRLEQLIAEAILVPMPTLIADVVDMICFIERSPGGRRVSDIVTVKGFDPVTHTYDLEHLC